MQINEPGETISPDASNFARRLCAAEASKRCDAIRRARHVVGKPRLPDAVDDAAVRMINRRQLLPAKGPGSAAPTPARRQR